MNTKEIKRATIGRLPQYLKYISSLPQEVSTVSATGIAKALDLGEVQVRKDLGNYPGRVCTIDARRISEEILGKNFPNTPMLAAAVKVSGVVDADQFVSNMEASFKHKFATKPQVIAGNMTVLTKSMQEVQEG